MHRDPEFSSDPRCPECGGTLLYNGDGFSCLVCPYEWKLPSPDSDRKILLPRRERPKS